MGEWQSSEMLRAVACRMISELVENIDHVHNHKDEDEDRHLRVAFWYCFVQDKDIAVQTHASPLLTWEYCGMAADKPTFSESQHLRHLMGEPKLSLVKESVYRLLYSAHALRVTSDGDILQRIRQLDDELEQWRLTLPPSICPKLIANLSQDDDPTNRLVYIKLQLDYYYLLISIHAAVRRTGAAHTRTDEEELPADLHSVVHSSYDISLEAGRNMLLFFKTVIEELEDGAFRYHFPKPSEATRP